MNAFQTVRPRGTTQQPTPGPSKPRGETSVLNAAGKWQAYLRPSTSIQIEDRAQGQASTDKRRAIVRGSL